ncbi:tRNA uridine-5-carboxymethylaminomethyl(34) synthesis GTPase MnmE [Petrimonas mucosa]|jgi:tRNA modification GTPase|uniref:tRNA modification GTPase MnmE n=2 Tax=Petrimonas TaxID=307628 RepID=A0A1G4G8P9_9BACT|nr:tRNA uridine-5-carboxymethylaminomethyl(34) synthesis GTPase MnmE [Petrimonas mucosa]MDD3560654.1 tRNA uridine-5-carboxymethylaminomethyl(34) synthesis GTPase MnmE [Petrimonas mucosa]SCM58895.1 tRNA modification GTPase MnmE {ECO:0000255/HAMAP-Rule:MF_00379} [Petrimonas mucosa]HHT29405.1 tRNA uridine-5-carboxymethylaminomethyl(34) synthesis GTPase MnmE [Petrimonas mucosa]
MNDIICAISTPPGMGAIAVIRLSGKGSIAVADTLFVSPSGKRLADAKANSVLFGEIRFNNEVTDEVLVTVFHAPRSFTGEESVEISCHGSVYIQQKIIEALIARGVRLAKPGEFTRRAFGNGKFDLSQAEAVADLIASSSQASHRVAMNQMRGGFASKLAELRDKLLQFVSLVELELDFAEEDVEFANRQKLYELTEEIEREIDKLARSFQLGNAIKNGIPVAIIGETNAGKSTLLNLLLNEEKAIVSDIHGTTRDVIEDTVNINGVTFRFIDTAGIRHTTDTIETLGIERTYQKIAQASIVLWMIDLTTPTEEINTLAQSIIPKLVDKHVLLLLNKSDLLSESEREEKQHLLPELKAERLFISAKKRQNTDQLQQLLLKAADIPQIGEHDVVVTNLRHYEALMNALEAVRRVKEGLDTGITSDFISQDIRECMFYLGEITGQISTDEILGNIFSKFCIGK